MNSDVSLDIAATGLETATTAGTRVAGDPADQTPWRAGRRRTMLALALSACAHALCLLLLPVMAGKGLEESARPVLVALEMLTVKDERSGTPLAGLPKPVFKKTDSFPPNRPAERLTPRDPSLPEHSEEQTAPLPAAARPAEPAPGDQTPTPETTPARLSAATAAIPATPSPVVTLAGNDGVTNQDSNRLAMDGKGRKMATTAEPDRMAQPGGGQALALVAHGQAAVTEARPLYRQNPAPEYPSQARRRQFEGLVQLEVLVTEAGNAAEVRIFASSGHELLDNAAAAAVRKWLFEPGRRGEQRVAMRVRVPVRFSLR